MVLPFVVEESGALGLEAAGFLRRCKKKSGNVLSAKEDFRSTWSQKGFSNFYLERLSVANLKGWGHFFTSAAAILRTV